MVLPVPALLILIGSCSRSRGDTEELFSQYIEASNAHNLEKLQSMTDDDIIWKLGPYTFTGKEEALKPHSLDALVHTTLEPRDITIRADTVECILIERNDNLKALGLDSLVHYARYVFRNSLMYRKEPWKNQSGDHEFSTRTMKFRSWAGKAHPGDLMTLDSLRAISPFAIETGKLRSRLLGEWVDAGRP